MEKAARMHRQGRGWVVGVWDERVGCYRESGEMSYWVARNIVAESNCPGGDKCPHAEQHEAQGQGETCILVTPE